MRAVVLAGGFGMRLRPYTTILPKPLLPIGDRPILEIILRLDGTFLAMNGDILTTLDYGALVAHHREVGAGLTIAVQGKRVDIDLGVLELDGTRVTGYREKPTLSYDVSMGIYVYEARVLEHLPEGPCQFPDLVQRLLEAGEHVSAFRSDEAWYDLGTISEYERAVAELERLGGTLA